MNSKEILIIGVAVAIVTYLLTRREPWHRLHSSGLISAIVPSC